LALLGLSIALFFPFTITTLLGFLLVGLGLSNIVPIAYSVAGRIPGVAAGVGISSVTTIGYAGFLLGPPVIGFISDWHNEAIAAGINPTEWWLDGSWRGLQFGLGLIWLLFLIMLVIAFFFLKIEDRMQKKGPETQ
jgi:MFS family permease